jgi:hypothetical protein
LPRYEARRTLPAPVEEVWAVLADPARWPEWWPGLVGAAPTVRRALAPGAHFGADLIETFEDLKSFVTKRGKLVQSRRDAIAEERAARAAGITLEHSYLDFENGFFSSPEWRRLHDEVRLIFGSGKILG